MDQVPERAAEAARKRDRASEGSRVGGFMDSAEGMWITNPFVSQCLRFPVTPHRYGFEITHTGGGNEAWVRDEGPDLELWVTGLDGDAATCDCRGWIMGLYYMGNDEREPIWCKRVHPDEHDLLDIADPDPRDAKLGGIETVANEEPPAKYGAGDMAAILEIVVDATEKLHGIGDILTGRDTHPLFDGYGPIDPARFYVGMIGERLVIELFGLERYLESIIERQD